MPQLNPSPWLMIFILIWMTFLFLFLSKAITLTHQNIPLKKQMKEPSLLSWNWPWH